MSKLKKFLSSTILLVSLRLNFVSTEPIVSQTKSAVREEGPLIDLNQVRNLCPLPPKLGYSGKRTKVIVK